MSADQRRQILAEHFAKRRHRRDKLSRAFENVYYTFDILGNLGLYRDLHRHRILTQERQDFTTVHGYDTPPEIEEAGFKNEFDDCMKRAADLYERIYADLPSEAQYVVPFAYKIRWYMKMNLREALAYVRAPHHAPGPSRLSLHLPGNVAQDSGGPSGIVRIRKIHRLAEVPAGTVAIGDADGVQEVGV